MLDFVQFCFPMNYNSWPASLGLLLLLFVIFIIVITKGLYFNIDVILWQILYQMPSMYNNNNNKASDAGQEL